MWRSLSIRYFGDLGSYMPVFYFDLNVVPLLLIVTGFPNAPPSPQFPRNQTNCFLGAASTYKALKQCSWIKKLLTIDQIWVCPSCDFHIYKLIPFRHPLDVVKGSSIAPADVGDSLPCLLVLIPNLIGNHSFLVCVFCWSAFIPF